MASIPSADTPESRRCTRCMAEKPLTREFFQPRVQGFTNLSLKCLDSVTSSQKAKKAKLAMEDDVNPDTELPMDDLSEIPLEEFINKAEQVAAQVWNVTELRFIYHSKYNHKNSPSTRYVYHCAQQDKRQHKSSRSGGDTTAHDKEHMYTFACKGWLFITVSDLEPFATVQLKHDTDHAMYSGQDVPPDIRKYAEENCKLSTTVLWAEILKRDPNPLFKRRAIYAIAASAKCKEWFRDPDELKSANIILEENKEAGTGGHYSIASINLPQVKGWSGLPFSLPEVMSKFGGHIREVSLDSAWNTNASHYELYALLGESGDEGVKEQYIHAFLKHFKNQHELNPPFTLTDKDQSEINAFLKAFPDAKHQLCFWHCLWAIKQQLSILRRPPRFYNVTEARNEFSDAINKDFVPVGQVNGSEQVDFPLSQVSIPQVVIRLNGVLQNTAPPKPRLVICINGKNQTIQSHSENEPDTPDVEPQSNPESSSGDVKEEDYVVDDSEFSAFFGGDDTDDEFGPNWMFNDDSEKLSKDPGYVFCPSPHCKQLLHLFTHHFCQHPFFPKRLESTSWTQEQIRQNAVMEMYQFCYQRGLQEVWGYMWTSWYSPKMWDLWAWSTLPDLLSCLHTTMNIKNFWKQLKHDNLHHILHPCLDQLVWILIHEVTPSYVN
ncbi:hypothetical protein D9758_009722 [Tetrapyrgos nigripes]|uniref:MULE transposase domain-containing protein n=1 Tax=Tetrapyrgos nigripes TaxID=182062 RepID=A0A8H5CNW5_9AGAR|nr:hypothetical protein D9758_009722 [Tetrapyrgos nigripes]